MDEAVWEKAVIMFNLPILFAEAEPLREKLCLFASIRSGIMESYEQDEWQSVNDLEKEKSIHTQYAPNTSIKNKRISIRITERDFLSLMARLRKKHHN